MNETPRVRRGVNATGIAAAPIVPALSLVLPLMLPLTLPLMLSACSTEGRCGPNASCISPQVWIDVCAEPQHVLGGVLLGGVEECSVDFGVVDGAFGAERNVRFTNPAKLLTTIELTLEADDPFTIATTLTEIEPNFSADAVIRVAPLDEGVVVSSRMIVTSNANNYVGDAIEIELRARGVRQTR